MAASAKCWGVEAELLDPDGVLKLFPWINKDKILGGFYTPSVGVVDSLDPAMDDAWMEMLGTYRVGLVRTAEHINWKYARHPVLDYRVRVARREGRPAGYMCKSISLER